LISKGLPGLTLRLLLMNMHSEGQGPLGVGFGIWDLGFGDWGLALGFGPWDLGFGIWDLGFDTMTSGRRSL
jgi:hypothetical protein